MPESDFYNKVYSLAGQQCQLISGGVTYSVLITEMGAASPRMNGDILIELGCITTDVFYLNEDMRSHYPRVSDPDLKDILKYGDDEFDCYITDINITVPSVGRSETLGGDMRTFATGPTECKITLTVFGGMGTTSKKPKKLTRFEMMDLDD